MSGEIARLFVTTPAERQRDRVLERIDHNAEVALARVHGVAQVARSAMLSTLGLATLQQQAAFMAPAAAEKLDLVATHAVLGMAAIVHRLADT